MGSEVEGTYKNGEGEQNKFCEEYLRRSEWGRQRTGKDTVAGSSRQDHNRRVQTKYVHKRVKDVDSLSVMDTTNCIGTTEPSSKHAQCRTVRGWSPGAE